MFAKSIVFFFFFFLLKSATRIFVVYNIKALNMVIFGGKWQRATFVVHIRGRIQVVAPKIGGTVLSQAASHSSGSLRLLV